nr:probable protein phosphatase 2C 47 [Ipomoea batatas]
MATATSLRCCNAELDNGICKEKIEVENQEESEPGRAGKPPRNRPMMHHSISQAALTDDSHQHLDVTPENSLLLVSFYGVFDGHGWCSDAASYMLERILLNLIVEDSDFPLADEKKPISGMLF